MKAKLEFALENAGWPALLVDESCNVRRVNHSAVLTFGAVLEGETVSLHSIWSVENEVTPEQFLNRLDRSEGAITSLKFQVKGGTVALFRNYVAPIIREERKYYVFQLFPQNQAPGEAPSGAPSPEAGSQLDNGQAQKQKLDCALQLIRTVSLDFNNALTSILGHTSLILGKMEPDHPWRSSLVEVEKSAEKAAEISHDLAAFSRQEKDTRMLAAGNLNDLVRRTVDLFRAGGSHKIHWQLQLESRLYSVSFDEAKMQQAIVKILDNSVQAVGAEGTISIRNHNLELAEPIRDGTATIASGNYVCVEINDTGCGIPAEVLPRIFEPFFSTKPNHRGLGLAWVYGIITNHGGTVTVSSRPGAGTTVRVYLPALKKLVKDRAFKTEELGGTQTILMVDDEDLLLTMGETVLSSFGYQVLTANSGQKALEIFAANPERIDLVITDLVMPHMSGRELMEHLRGWDPNIKIICSSGFVRPRGDEDEAYLRKPFTSQELLLKVKQILQPNETS